jgi:hypothetical protein
LRRTFETANGACDSISEQAWHHKSFRQLALDKLPTTKTANALVCPLSSAGYRPNVTRFRIVAFVSLQAAFSRSHKPPPLGEGGLLFPLQ